LIRGSPRRDTCFQLELARPLPSKLTTGRSALADTPMTESGLDASVGLLPLRVGRAQQVARDGADVGLATAVRDPLHVVRLHDVQVLVGPAAWVEAHRPRGVEERVGVDNLGVEPEAVADVVPAVARCRCRSSTGPCPRTCRSSDRPPAPRAGCSWRRMSPSRARRSSRTRTCPCCPRSGPGRSAAPRGDSRSGRSWARARPRRGRRGG
jgi:hypothetical protein